MSKLTARHLDAGLERPRLAAVDWSVPSAEPDTTELDESWFEVAPRHSFIALKGTFGHELGVRSSEAVTPSSVPLAYDLWESAHALIVLIDLPGVCAEHVALSLGSQALHLDVSAVAGHESWGCVASGHHEVPLEAQLAAGPESIDASLKNGLLRIRIAKEGAGTRRVAIVTNPEQD